MKAYYLEDGFAQYELNKLGSMIYWKDLENHHSTFVCHQQLFVLTIKYCKDKTNKTLDHENDVLPLLLTTNCLF